MKRLVFAVLLLACSCSSGPEVESKAAKDFVLDITLEQMTTIQTGHVRGLFMVNDRVVWASGAGGTIMKCVDGTNWTADTIAGYTHLDFRDVHAFDGQTALVMAAGDEGRILRTEDGGENWVEVYTNLQEGIFLDGMDFQGNIGYCYGDPINGTMIILRTEDQGKTWVEMNSDEIPVALPKEAGFAASGTGIVAYEKMTYIATGGDSVARVLISVLGQNGWRAVNTPMRSEEGCGVFSMARTNNNLVAVGGCYLDSASTERNCAYSADQGRTWQLANEHPPTGYRSCVAYSQRSDLLVSCGRTGIDYSTDEGVSWTALSNEGYYTCALGDSFGWLMGRGGKMAKLSW